jgi:hypothetical protein
VLAGTSRLLAVRGRGKAGRRLVERLLRQRRLNIYRRIDLIVQEKRLNEWTLDRLVAEELERLRRARGAEREKERQRKRDDDRLRAPGRSGFKGKAAAGAAAGGGGGAAGRPGGGALLSVGEESEPSDSSGQPSLVLFEGNASSSPQRAAGESNIITLNIPTPHVDLPSEDVTERRRRLAKEVGRFFFFFFFFFQTLIFFLFLPHFRTCLVEIIIIIINIIIITHTHTQTDAGTGPAACEFHRHVDDDCAQPDRLRFDPDHSPRARHRQRRRSLGSSRDCARRDWHCRRGAGGGDCATHPAHSLARWTGAFAKTAHSVTARRDAVRVVVPINQNEVKIFF